MRQKYTGVKNQIWDYDFILFDKRECCVQTKATRDISSSSMKMTGQLGLCLCAKNYFKTPKTVLLYYNKRVYYVL